MNLLLLYVKIIIVTYKAIIGLCTIKSINNNKLKFGKLCITKNIKKFENMCLYKLKH